MHILVPVVDGPSSGSNGHFKLGLPNQSVLAVEFHVNVFQCI